jgi:hypothetical protein
MHNRGPIRCKSASIQSTTLKFIGNEKAETFRFLEKKMDAKILALIQTDPKRRLMPEEIAAVNAYVTAGKTSDLISLGTEVSNNAIGYHKSKTKLSDHGEYLGAVKATFDRLPKDGRIDGEAKWTRWLESTFRAYDKNQKDYFTKLANAHIKLIRNDQPKPKINYKTLALDLARMVLCGDTDGAEKLAQQIAQENGDKIEKAENSAFSAEAEADPKSKASRWQDRKKRKIPLVEEINETIHAFNEELDGEADHHIPLKHHTMEIV